LKKGRRARKNLQKYKLHLRSSYNSCEFASGINADTGGLPACLSSYTNKIKLSIKEDADG
jgi:hypothetical protein